jgi:hypothetical protein
MQARRATEAKVAFLEAKAYNRLVEGTDAHAKNYSLPHTATGSHFAPLYDVASALPHLRMPDWAEQKLTLAMSVGKHYRILEIARRHWEGEAERAGVELDVLTSRRVEMAAALPSAVSASVDALTDLDIDQDEVQHFVEVGTAHAHRALRTMDDTGSERAPKRVPQTNSQPRPGDLGATKYRGRFGSKHNSEPEITLEWQRTICNSSRKRDTAHGRSRDTGHDRARIGNKRYQRSIDTAATLRRTRPQRPTEAPRAIVAVMRWKRQPVQNSRSQRRRGHGLCQRGTRRISPIRVSSVRGHTSHHFQWQRNDAWSGIAADAVAATTP